MLYAKERHLEFISDYGLFLLKAVTVVVSIVVVIAVVTAAGMKKREKKGGIVVESLNDSFSEMEDAMFHAVSSELAIKEREKAEKKTAKDKKKQSKKAAKAKGEDNSTASETDVKPRRFVIEFSGDINASQGEILRHEVTAILAIAQAGDEVVVRLESPGGVVHGYGFAAAQLERLKSAGLTLTIAIDKVAASGGYMMACLGSRIIASPFAVVGSIGVLAQVPNFHRLLKKHDVDVELHTAGKFKRTLTMLGENTDEAREKFKEELEEIHTLFKDMVSEARPQLDMEAVATGEAWYGKRALELQLVDELKTCDDYLFSGRKEFDQYTVEWREKVGIADRLGIAALATMKRGATSLLSALQRPSI